jgi:hypothetical protein
MKLTPAGSLMSRAMTVFRQPRLRCAWGGSSRAAPFTTRASAGSNLGPPEVHARYISSLTRLDPRPLHSRHRPFCYQRASRGRFDAGDVFHPGRRTAVDSKYIAVTVNPLSIPAIRLEHG